MTRLGLAGLLAAALALAPANGLAAPRESEIALEAMLAAEESLAETADIARLSNLRAQESASLALSKAAVALASALDAASAPAGGAKGKKAAGDEGDDSDDERAAEASARGAVAREQRLVMAQLAHAQALEALERVLAERRTLEARAADHRARVDALRQSLARVRATAPPRGELDGAWTIVLSPLAETLTARLSQEGPFVGGSFESSSGATGTLSGQVAGGHVRLERHEPGQGKVADLVGMLTKGGGFEGTWQSTLLGTGRAEAGTFVGSALAEE